MKICMKKHHLASFLWKHSNEDKFFEYFIGAPYAFHRFFYYNIVWISSVMARHGTSMVCVVSAWSRLSRHAYSYMAGLPKAEYTIDVKTTYVVIRFGRIATVGSNMAVWRTLQY